MWITVTVYLKSKQLILFTFARQCYWCFYEHTKQISQHDSGKQFFIENVNVNLYHISL